ncbi:hypothetical protein ASPVEDRAFT_37710 [Aspergillus versicolor CBS 583.65]|uniref:CFEM domain-containing protein n=1 Tax=Aspergillus versicolor CBS 583.65 TaxID=1036611 RepID=A0A1L9P9U0_ASPVE|nr:uncharacterized protein ASPVEDRAFT_37710 [Aspergillus versicolor CBS 583.65]OJI98266.1 hypothetical protein ASPVEDRAFT_37710 [Aspergillus versicolor CBS 583.65]
MRLVVWSAYAVAAFAAAVGAQTMPDCAADCLVKGLEDSTCSPTDSECICADAVLMENVQACSMLACTVVEGLKASNATATLCHWPVHDKRLVAPIATAVTGVIALAFILVRVSDCVSKNEYKWADLCAVLAFIFSLPMDIFEFFMMGSGMGRDVWTLTPTQITNTAKYTWVTQVWYIPAIILTKVAIVSFFMQIFPGPRFRLLCQGTIIHCFLFMISTFITEILSCIPVEDAWTNWRGESNAICYDNSAFWWAHSAINIATDLWVLGLPIPMLWGLQLKLKKKIYLVLMFSVGIVITVISIVRFSGLLKYSTTTNITYNNVMVATYSVIECNVSIMCCCMPALLSTLRRGFPTVFGSTGPSPSYNSAPFSGSNGIHKEVTHKVTYMPRDGTSDDAIELVDRDGREGETETHVEGNGTDTGRSKW